MKSFEVVGYTADAGVWCTNCAEEKYGPAALGICPDCREFIYPAASDVCLTCCFDFGKCNMTDEEGNPVNPIFRGDDWDYGIHCEECDEEIDVCIISEESII